jgi:uncharacterized membrane protein YgdD (TMEM256/DUF423 family)
MADRVLIALAALLGLAGVALSAAAAHAGGGSNLETAARFLLVHAAAVLALAALAGLGSIHPFLARAAAFALILGVGLFAGDLTLRALRGAALFPTAAPAGGFVMMAGWGLAAVAALWPRS